MARGGDELATLRITASGGDYDGISGTVYASVDDMLTLLPSSTLTTRPGVPDEVGVNVRPGAAARVTVAPPSDDTSTAATGAGYGIGTTAAARASVAAIAVTNAPANGLEICLPVASELRAESGSALIMTLLRYANGAWTEIDGTRDLGDQVCAGGISGDGSYASAYARAPSRGSGCRPVSSVRVGLRPGAVLDLAASLGADPGTIQLSGTPPAAGTYQVAVVVNVSDDADCCLDVLPGLDASIYACEGRTPGAAYVVLLIVLLPDGGCALANIVTITLPVAGASQ